MSKANKGLMLIFLMYQKKDFDFTANRTYFHFHFITRCVLSNPLE